MNLIKVSMAAQMLQPQPTQSIIGRAWGHGAAARHLLKPRNSTAMHHQELCCHQRRLHLLQIKLPVQWQCSKGIGSHCEYMHHRPLHLSGNASIRRCMPLHCTAFVHQHPCASYCTTRSSRFRIPSTPRQAPSYHIKEKPPRAEICR